MADGSSTDAAFDVFTQVFTLIGPDGVTEIPVSVDLVNEVFGERFVVQANYGSQIGATIVMLLAYLLMTPATKFRCAPTIINILALVFNAIRCVLLAWFPTSEWFEFYTLFSGDYSHVPASDYHTSVAATVFTIPVIILIEAALVVQAWAMIQLWPPAYKYTAVVVSVIIALAAVALKFASSISQALAILYPVWPSYSVRKADLAFSTASIFWFCFLFNVRLAMHMWTHRSILPSVKGMSAMEVLVVTNGVLMLVPALFAGLQYGDWAEFEFGSMTYTSVVVMLPLGTLAAQRIANPSAFSSPGGSNASNNNNRNDPPALKSWHSTTDGGSRGGVSAHVESHGGQVPRNSMQEAGSGFAKYDGADMEKGVIRVQRQIQHHEEMA